MIGESSRTGSGSAPPNTASELVNTNLGGASRRAAALEQRARRVEIDAHADVELRLGLSADDRREMEHAVGIRRDRALDQRRIGEVAGDGVRRADRRPTRGATSTSTIASDRALAAARVGERAALRAMLRASRLPRNPAPPVMTMRMRSSLIVRCRVSRIARGLRRIIR